ncbi:MAG: aryl-alcohol dehydrogenase-like predicted oxidoreductase [Saprospiraceae bacterium]|jgi:aryl-alcohol dehydrogenase-like predicted oxidoreductase
MKYNKLGLSDLSVSRVCLGSMNYGEQNTQEDGFEQMDYALANGVNFIDTAEMYSVPGRPETCGATEKIIGNWMESRRNRDELVLATKVVGHSPGLSYIRNGPDFSRTQINQAIEGSLSKLKTDVVDLYQLHWPKRGNNKFGVRIYPFAENEGSHWKDEFLNQAESMNILIKEGKIKHWGLSNETTWGVMRFLQLCKDNSLIPPVSIQNAYGLLNRQFEYGLSELCQFEGLGLLAYSPLAFGALTGKYLNGAQPKGARLTEYKIFNRFLNNRAMEATAAYQKLAMENDMSVVSMALAFVYGQEFAHSTIVGATSVAQLKENIDAEKIILSDELIKEINVIFDQFPDPAP